MIGQRHQVYILDFGIGCLLAETEGESLVDTMSTANSVASGLDCASPESIMDPTNLTPAGDQYSLGCTLYFCLTGQYPFPDGSAAEKMMAHQMKEPTPIRELSPGVPAELALVISRLMQKSPQARFAHTADVVEAFRPFAAALVENSKAAARSGPNPGAAFSGGQPSAPPRSGAAPAAPRRHPPPTPPPPQPPPP